MIALVFFVVVIAALAGAPLWIVLIADAFLVWLLWNETTA